MRVLLRGAGVAVLLWFAFAAAVSRVRAGTVALERCVRLEPEWPEETAVAAGTMVARHAEQSSPETDRGESDAASPGAAGATAVAPSANATSGAILIPLPAPLLTGTVGLLGVATALLFRRVRRAV